MSPTDGTAFIGPVLNSVLALSTTQGQVAGGALLLSVCLSSKWRPSPNRLQEPLAWLRQHGTAISAIGLGAMEILLVLERLAWITTLVRKVA